jgi:dTDP-4-amino-4,6-dideoxygalactose transaminase
MINPEKIYLLKEIEDYLDSISQDLEQLEKFVLNKRELANLYKRFFDNCDFADFIPEIEGGYSNYWLNAIRLHVPNERDTFLSVLNKDGIMVRPIWTLMNKLPEFENDYCDDIQKSSDLESCIINLPSSVRI